MITDEYSLQIRLINIKMKGPGVSSRRSRGEIDSLNSRGEQDGVSGCSLSIFTIDLVNILQKPSVEVKTLLTS